MGLQPMATFGKAPEEKSGQAFQAILKYMVTIGLKGLPNNSHRHRLW